jgi:hypothetical protein
MPNKTLEEKSVEINVSVPKNSSCLLYAITMAYLYPLLNKEDLFKSACDRLFGKDNVRIQAGYPSSAEISLSLSKRDWQPLKNLIEIHLRQRILGFIDDNHKVKFGKFTFEFLLSRQMLSYEETLAEYKKPTAYLGRIIILAFAFFLNVHIDVCEGDQNISKDQYSVNKSQGAIRLKLMSDHHYHFLINKQYMQKKRDNKKDKQPVVTGSSFFATDFKANRLKLRAEYLSDTDNDIEPKLNGKELSYTDNDIEENFTFFDQDSKIDKSLYELSDNELSDEELSDHELSDNEFNNNKLSNNESSDSDSSNHESSNHESSDSESSDERDYSSLVSSSFDEQRHEEVYNKSYSNSELNYLLKHHVKELSGFYTKASGDLRLLDVTIITEEGDNTELLQKVRDFKKHSYSQAKLIVPLRFSDHHMALFWITPSKKSKQLPSFSYFDPADKPLPKPLITALREDDLYPRLKRWNIVIYSENLQDDSDYSSPYIVKAVEDLIVSDFKLDVAKVRKIDVQEARLAYAKILKKVTEQSDHIEDFAITPSFSF